MSLSGSRRMRSAWSAASVCCLVRSTSRAMGLAACSCAPRRGSTTAASAASASGGNAADGTFPRGPVPADDGSKRPASAGDVLHEPANLVADCRGFPGEERGELVGCEHPRGRLSGRLRVEVALDRRHDDYPAERALE